METVIFTIAFDPAKEVFEDDDLKKFLLNKKIKHIRPEFFQTKEKAYWTVFAEYETVLDDSAKAKNQPALSEPEHLLFNKLRIWRTEKAEKEGIPVFIIATNSELVAVVKKSPTNLEVLRSIKGFGKKKIDRHGKEIIEIVKAFHAQKPIYGQKGGSRHD